MIVTVYAKKYQQNSANLGASACALRLENNQGLSVFKRCISPVTGEMLQPCKVLIRERSINVRLWSRTNC